jgi:hypothetical protein
MEQSHLKTVYIDFEAGLPIHDPTTKTVYGVSPVLFLLLWFKLRIVEGLK